MELWKQRNLGHQREDSEALFTKYQGYPEKSLILCKFTLISILCLAHQAKEASRMRNPWSSTQHWNTKASRLILKKKKMFSRIALFVFPFPSWGKMPSEMVLKFFQMSFQTNYHCPRKKNVSIFPPLPPTSDRRLDPNCVRILVHAIYKVGLLLLDSTYKHIQILLYVTFQTSHDVLKNTTFFSRKRIIHAFSDY